MLGTINFKKAYIDIRKLEDYCLNEFHPFGKDKAKVFKSLLGIESKDAELLRIAILDGLGETDIILKEKDKFGLRFSAIVKIRIFEKEAFVTTGWIIKTGEDFPRLTTCYISNKTK